MRDLLWTGYLTERESLPLSMGSMRDPLREERNKGRVGTHGYRQSVTILANSKMTKPMAKECFTTSGVKSYGRGSGEEVYHSD